METLYRPCWFFRGILFTFFLCLPLTAQHLLTLEDALGIALQNNYAVVIARNEAQIAENNATLGNAGFLPRIDLSARQSKSITDSRTNFITGNVIDREGAEFESRGADAQLNWVVFDGFRMFFSYNRLGALEDIGRIQMQRSVEETVRDVILTYYDIVQQKQNLEVARESVEISRERVSIAENNLQLGAASRLDVLQARVDLNSDSSALLRQQVAYDNAKIQLNRLLARSVATDFAVTDSIVLQQTLNAEELQNLLPEHNRDLRFTRQQLNVARAEYREVRSEWLPTLSLNTGYNYSRSESEAGFTTSSQSSGFTYGATLTFNLFEGFNLRRREQNARIEIRNTEVFLEDIRSQIQASFAIAYQNYLNNLERIRLEEENLDIARENVDVSLERFRLGTITPLELREAQQNYTAAQSRLINARYEAKQSETELLRLSGQLIGEE